MSLATSHRTIAEFKHWVEICRGEDVIVDGQLTFQQRSAYKGWAMFEQRRVSTYSQQGHTVFEEKDRRTHFIFMRYNPQVEITTAAWIYEARRKSPPRWFKILFAGDENEEGKFFRFECRLMEAGDNIIEPISDQKILGVPDGMVF